jgi:hypothetical protein
MDDVPLSLLESQKGYRRTIKYSQPEEAIACRFDDAAPMLGDFGIAQFTANNPPPSQTLRLALGYGSNGAFLPIAVAGNE